MTKIVNVLLAVSLLLTLATLGYSSAIAAPAVKTVCIGVSAPLSGGEPLWAEIWYMGPGWRLRI